MSGFLRSGRLSVMVATLPSTLPQEVLRLEIGENRRAAGWKRLAVSFMGIFLFMLLRAIDVVERASTRKRQPAADAQHLPGDVVGARAREEQDRVGDLLRLGEAPERDRLDEGFPELVGP